MLICDTSALIAFFDASDVHSEAVRQAIEADRGPYVVSPYVIAELDYLMATRRGTSAELVVLRELAGGAWELPALDAGDVGAICEVIARYQDLNVGVADASLVRLAARYRTRRLLTLDRRHFGVIRTSSGQAFELVPSY